MSEPADLVVVGAGPAGMAAAATALAGGLRVVLVDSGTAVGGQYWRHPPERARAAIPTDDLHHGLRRYRALCEALAGGPGRGPARPAPGAPRLVLPPDLLANVFAVKRLTVGVKEFSGDVRRCYKISELAPGLDLMIGTDDTVLEVGRRRGQGLGRRVPAGLPPGLSRPVRGVACAGDLETRAAALPSTAPGAAVGQQDGVRPGHQARPGDDRPPRWCLPPAATAARPARPRPSCAPPPRPSSTPG
ncbi:hypothetical protein STENM327S_02444 [Streptomyces tendae]